MSTVEKAEGKWELIYNHFGLKATPRQWESECPFCKKIKSFRISPETINYGGAICTCGNYNGIQVLMEVTGKGFKEVCDEIDGIIGNEFVPDKNKDTRDNKKQRAIDYFRSLKPIKGTGVETYLNHRGIFKMPVRCIKAGVENIGGVDYDVMVATATTDDGHPCYWHRTYIKNGRKADITPNKKMEKITETSESIAIRTSYREEQLGVAEGIETAMKAEALYRVRTWPTMSSSFLKRFKCPPGVTRLIIFADSDPKGAGHAAAFECAHKNLVCKNDVKEVIVRWPEKGDFGDEIIGEVFEWVFKP